MGDENNVYGNSGQPENGALYQYGQQDPPPFHEEPSSDYNGPSGHTSPSDYNGPSGYTSPSDYKEPSGHTSPSDYHASPEYTSPSDYNGPSGHASSSDYNASSGYNSASDYNASPGYASSSDYDGSGYNPPPGGPANGYYGQPPSQGFGIASLVCGILALVMCCIWCLSIPLGVVSIVLGILQIQKKTAKGMAIAGIVCSVLGILLSIVVFISARFAQTQYMDSPMYNEIMREIMEEMYSD